MMPSGWHRCDMAEWSSEEVLDKQFFPQPLTFSKSAERAGNKVQFSHGVASETMPKNKPEAFPKCHKAKGNAVSTTWPMTGLNIAQSHRHIIAFVKYISLALPVSLTFEQTSSLYGFHGYIPFHFQKQACYYFVSMYHAISSCCKAHSESRKAIFQDLFGTRSSYSLLRRKKGHAILYLFIGPYAKTKNHHMGETSKIHSVMDLC